MLRRMRKKYISLIFSVTICLGTILMTHSVSFAQTDSSPVPIEFKIPQHSVADALILFGEQSGEQIIFRYDEARNISARRLSGRYRPIAALAEILKDTGLIAFRNPEGTIVVRKDPDFKPVISTAKNKPSFKKEKPKNIFTGASESETAGRLPEELVITGSRIKRAELSAPNLVSIIESETIMRTGTANIEELLNKLPQIVSSLTGNSNNPGEGIANVDLRGLGAIRTLVLINGRRYVPGNQTGIVDLNTIPTFLLDKIEVATGGTSAVYGSDAIAGVVNFKLRDDFDGFEGLTRYRVSKDGDGDKYDVNLVYGQSFNDDKGSAFLHFEALERQAVMQRDRDFSFFALSDSFIRPGSTDPRFGFGEFLSPEDGGVPGFIPIGSIFIPGGLVMGIPPSGPHPGLERFGMNGEALAFDSLTDRFNFAPFNFLQLPQNRISATFGAKYRLTDNVEFFNQILFSQNKVDLELAPTPVILENFVVPVENPFLQENARAALRGIDWYGTGKILQARDAGGNPMFDNGNPIQARQALSSTLNPLWAADGSPIAAVGGSAGNKGELLFIADGQAEIPVFLRRMTEIGPRQIKNKRHSLNVVLGLQGEFAPDWNFLVHYNYNRYKNTKRNINAVSINNFRAAANVIQSGGDYICSDPVARQDGCVPANIYGEGNLSPEAIEYITVNRAESTQYTRQDITAYLNGTIDYGVGDGLTLLIGTDWRKEDSSFVGDDAALSDPGSGFSDTFAAIGKYSVLSLFSEFKLPLVEGMTGFETLELSGALRYSDYSISGSAWSAAAGFNWQPFSDLRIRGQYQRAIREPNISELFSEGNNSLIDIDDPCVEGNIDIYGDINDICIATGVPANLVGNFDQETIRVRQIISGNMNLEVEKSDTFTLGLIYQPSFLPEVQLTVDYYHIALHDQIALFSGGASEIISNCFREDNSNPQSCDMISRRPDGQLDFINASLENISQTTTSGIDGQLFYQKQLDWNLLGDNEKFELIFQGSYLINNKLELANGRTLIDCAGKFSGGCGTPLPKFRFTQLATWSSDKLELSVRWRHFGSIKNRNAEIRDVAVPRLPAENYFDLYAQYHMSENVIIRSGVDNIFNVKPNFIGTDQEQANTFPTIYDVLGPYFHFGINIFY